MRASASPCGVRHRDGGGRGRRDAARHGPPDAPDDAPGRRPAAAASRRMTPSASSISAAGARRSAHWSACCGRGGARSAGGRCGRRPAPWWRRGTGGVRGAGGHAIGTRNQPTPRWVGHDDADCVLEPRLRGATYLLRVPWSICRLPLPAGRCRRDGGLAPLVAFRRGALIIRVDDARRPADGAPRRGCPCGRRRCRGCPPAYPARRAGRSGCRRAGRSG